MPEASNAAARLLEIATRNADELVEDAKNEADKIVGEARTKAERLESESKTKADRLEADARSRAQMLDSETAERRQQMFGDLEKERDKLNGEVENLRSFEREYRSRLKSYFTPAAGGARQRLETQAPVDERHPRRSGCARSWARTRADHLLARADDDTAGPSGSAVRRVSGAPSLSASGSQRLPSLPPCGPGHTLTDAEEALAWLAPRGSRLAGTAAAAAKR